MCGTGELEGRSRSAKVNHRVGGELLTEDDQGRHDTDHDEVEGTVFQHLGNNVHQSRTSGKTKRRLTIHLRCFFCFMENRGGRICLDGRNQTKQNTILEPEKKNVKPTRENSQSIVE